MTKDPRVYLAHILECAERIERYMEGGRNEVLRDTMIQDAVIRNFEVIGEAAKRIPDDYRQKHAAMPWRLMAASRGVLIHACEGVDLKQVWRIATRDLPPVKKAIAGILPPLDQLEEELNGGDGPGGEQDGGAR